MQSSLLHLLHIDVRILAGPNLRQFLDILFLFLPPLRLLQRRSPMHLIDIVNQIAAKLRILYVILRLPARNDRVLFDGFHHILLILLAVAEHHLLLRQASSCSSLLFIPYHLRYVIRLGKVITFIRFL